MLTSIISKFESDDRLNALDKTFFISAKDHIVKQLGDCSHLEEEQIKKQIIKLFTIFCYESKLQLYQQTYAGITTEAAKLLIPKEATAVVADASVPWNASVYGEVEFSSFVNIMQRCCYISSTLPSNANNPAKKNKIFVDLGHGLGKAMVATSLLFGPQFSHIYGIEYLEPLYNESIHRIDRYKEIMASAGHQLEHEICPIFGDFLDNQSFDWTTAGTLSN